MKIFLILSLCFFIIACVPKTKNIALTGDQVKENPPIVYVPESATKIKEVQVLENKTFLDVISKNGIPDENIIPRSKEQITVYKKDNKVSFYYFKKNRLIAKKDYEFLEIEEMKSNAVYPSKVLKDLSAI